MGHNLTFGDVSIKDFGVCISGEGLFNAPKKDVESIDIPGRNGALLIDNGRYENIEVTYPAAFYKEGLYNFIANLSALRAALLSKKGYQRIEDSFHPDEFRMGALIGGLEVDPVKFNTAATFDMVFDCKPQRFLKSGEVAQEFTADGEILNPTFYESSPLLEVEGRGDIVINGYPIEINVDPLGELPLFGAVTTSGTNASNTFEEVPYIAGDDVIVKGTEWTVDVGMLNGTQIYDPAPMGTGVNVSAAIVSAMLRFTASLPTATFTAGTAETKTYSADCDFTAAAVTHNVALALSLVYNGDKKVTAQMSITLGDNLFAILNRATKLGAGAVDSSKTSLGKTLYIDCEVGEVYTASGEDYNNAATLGAELPKLQPGVNEITIANTIDSLRIIPRWWTI